MERIQFPSPLTKVIDVLRWNRKNPLVEGGFVTVDAAAAEIVTNLVVYKSGKTIATVDLPEGCGAICLPWLFDCEVGHILAGPVEDLAVILEAYEEMHRTRKKFYEVIENLVD